MTGNQSLSEEAKQANIARSLVKLQSQYNYASTYGTPDASLLHNTSKKDADEFWKGVEKQKQQEEAKVKEAEQEARNVEAAKEQQVEQEKKTKAQAEEVAKRDERMKGFNAHIVEFGKQITTFGQDAKVTPTGADVIKEEKVSIEKEFKMKLGSEPNTAALIDVPPLPAIDLPDFRAPIARTPAP